MKDNEKYGLPSNINLKGLSEQQKTKFAKVYKLIEAEGAKFPEVVAFQWALETGWGKQASGKNNVFGVKALPGQKGTVRTTKEDFGKGNETYKDKFLDYDTEEDSVRDRLNRPKWKKAEESTDTPEDYIDYITFINKYATDKQYDIILKGMLKDRAGYNIEVPKVLNTAKGSSDIDKVQANHEARKIQFLDKLAGKAEGKAIQSARNMNERFNNGDNSVQNDNIRIPQFRPTISNTPELDPMQPYSTENSTRNLDYLDGLNNFNYTSRFIPTEDQNMDNKVVEQTEKKEREQTFNFKGSPMLSRKKGLVDNKQFQYGGLLTEFNEGGSHGENPLGGIPQGNDEDGVQRLVEEGETRYNDYIFSNKFYLEEEDVQQARLSPNLIGKSIAEASKEINKYLDEAPFDKITRDTVTEQLDNLMVINEKYKSIVEMDNLRGIEEDPTDAIMEASSTTDNALAALMGIEEDGSEMPLEEEGSFSDPNAPLLPDMAIGGEEEFALGGGLGYSNSVDIAVQNGKFNQFKPTNSGGSFNAQGLLGGLMGGMGSAMGGQTMYGNSQDNAMLGGVKDTVASAFGPIGQIARGAQKLGEGIGNTIGGDAGAAVSSVFSPEESTLANLKDKDLNIGQKLLGTIPGVGGVIASNSKRKKLEKAKERKMTGMYNDKFFNEDLTFQMESGGDKNKSRKRIQAERLPSLYTIPGTNKTYQYKHEKEAYENIINNMRKQKGTLTSSDLINAERIVENMYSRVPNDISNSPVDGSLRGIDGEPYFLEENELSPTERMFAFGEPIKDLVNKEELKDYSNWKASQGNKSIASSNTTKKKPLTSKGQAKVFTPSANKIVEDVIADREKSQYIATPAMASDRNTNLTVPTSDEIQDSAMVYSGYRPTREEAIVATADATASGIQGEPSVRVGNESSEKGFTPKSSTLSDILGAAPIAGSLLNVMNPVEAEKVGYQTSTFKYQPNRIDENSILNSVRQSGANTLRSLEQSGMSAGQMANAKLATGANEMRAISDAMLKVNDYNNSEKSREQDYEFQVNNINRETINRQIEDNAAARGIAETQNRQYLDNLFANIGEYGLEQQRKNTHYNVSRGYSTEGILKNKKNKSFEEGGTLKDKFRVKSEEYLILEQLLSGK